jgi:type VI secretion system protein ImpE
MPTAAELYQAGQLNAAIEAQLQAVRSAPLDSGRRTFLFELLAFAGQWDRADQQLAVMAQETAEKGWGATVYQNLLKAERARQMVFAGQARPDVFLDPPPFIATRCEALELFTRGTPEATAAGLAKLAESDATVPTIQGTINGQPVTGLRDADDLLSPILEVMLMRDYVWVPWAQIRELEIEKPMHVRDLLWSPARITLSDGEERRGYIPALYPGTPTSPDDNVRLGRLSSWLVPEGDGPVRGVGQHVLVAGDSTSSDQDFGLLEVRKFIASGQ